MGPEPQVRLAGFVVTIDELVVTERGRGVGIMPARRGPFENARDLWRLGRSY
jgi:hypothetical protein